MSKFTKDMLLEAVQQTKVKLSNGKTVRVRAMLMKEFKILMLAAESESSMEDSIVQVLRGCVLDDKIDIGTLPIFDVETLYVTIWKLSKGTSIIPVKFRCVNEIERPIPDDEEGKTYMGRCDTEISVQINLNQAKLSKVPNPMVKISDRLSVEMRYPNVYETEYFDVQKDSDLFDLVLRCVSKVHLNGDVMVVGTDIPYEELSEVMDYVDDKGFAKMAAFVNELPQLSLTAAVKCPHCGHCEPVEMIGLADFFG